MRSRWMATIVLVVVMALTGAGVLYATTNGLLNPTNPPESTSSYTLEHIYQRLATGAYAKQGTFKEPASGPGTGTMHTLDQIMAKARPGAFAPRVPKTGQTTCWDASGVIPCAGTGQDGEYQVGVLPALPPGLGGVDSAYNSPAWTGVRFTDNGDGTVTDNLTALVWLKNANCLGFLGWQAAVDAANTLSSGSCGLNDGSAAGQWRLPNLNELHSLIDQRESLPALPAGHPFINVVGGGFYWSSTSSNHEVALAVRLFDGYVSYNGKTNSFTPVWAVRGGQ